MKSEVVSVPETFTESADSGVENQESSTPSTPSVTEGSSHGLLQVLGVFLIIFNVW